MSKQNQSAPATKKVAPPTTHQRRVVDSRVPLGTKVAPPVPTKTKPVPAKTKPVVSGSIGNKPAPAKQGVDKASKEAAKALKEADKAKAKALKEADKAAKAKEREEARARGAEDREANGKDTRMVPADLSKYTRTKEQKTAGGHVSVDVADALAVKLRGMQLPALYKEASATLKEPASDLMARYQHLNPGMQRMNLGNRMRAASNKVVKA